VPAADMCVLSIGWVAGDGCVCVCVCVCVVVCVGGGRGGGGAHHLFFFRVCNPRRECVEGEGLRVEADIASDLQWQHAYSLCAAKQARNALGYLILHQKSQE
jgi:hypothetical protein